jgi:RHS repeat-associated protein
LGLVVERNGASNTYYTRDNLGNVIGERTPDGSRWYYLKDGLQSVVAVTNEAGTTVPNRYRYDAWGVSACAGGSSCTTANPWGYASGYRDTTGLIKFGARFYDPTLGRWTQQDSISGTIFAPNSLNSYAYVMCNPVNAVDPSGSYCQAVIDLGNIYYAQSRFYWSQYQIWWWVPFWGAVLRNAAEWAFFLALYWWFWGWVEWCD